uniref:PRKCA-binding protein n=2 Tax=Amphimedon queenslandica TaxID=400682 RepID=A0A1X7V7Q8_AMPQE
MAYSVTLEKGKNNMIGISIGGGAPFCPVVYIVQLFHRTPAYEDGSLCPGDQLVSINGTSLVEYTRKQTADLIQSSQGTVHITFNRIHPPKEKSLDISMKKLKHKIVEKMKESTADTLGITRAVLVNDKLLKKLDHLEHTSKVCAGIAFNARDVIIQVKGLARGHHNMSSVFNNIGVYEPHTDASVAFANFGAAHKSMAEEGDKLVSRVGPMLKDLRTFLTKAVPDTKLTIKKYQSAKFEFLSYCLKVKEMDDEEYECNHIGQPLPRVMTGNYEYRVLLRCRHATKRKFMKLRSDVLVKLQLLDNKRVQDLAFQLERLIGGMYVYCRQSYNVLKPACVFPIEVQLQLEEKQGPIGMEEGERGTATLTEVKKKDDDDVPLLDLPAEEAKKEEGEKKEEVVDLISI